CDGIFQELCRAYGVEAVAFVGKDERGDFDSTIGFGVMARSGDEATDGVPQGQWILPEEPLRPLLCFVGGCRKAREVLRQFDGLFDAEVLHSSADEVEGLNRLPFGVAPELSRAEGRRDHERERAYADRAFDSDP